MDLKDLMSISGHPGLFRFISQGRNAIIVESLETGKRMSAYSTQRIITLEEVSIFTDSGEMPLAEVFTKIYRHTGGKEAPGHKSSGNEIKSFFEAVIPEYDRDRVYLSDMKKVIQWYNQLAGLDLIRPESGSGAGRGEDGGSKDSRGEDGGSKDSRDNDGGSQESQAEDPGEKEGGPGGEGAGNSSGTGDGEGPEADHYRKSGNAKNRPG